MARQDQSVVATRVAVLDPRRLVRQALCLWLAAQEGVSVTANITDPASLVQACRAGKLDVTILGAGAGGSLVQQVAMIAVNQPALRTIVLTENSDVESHEELIGRGLDALVTVSSGAAALLGAIRAGSVVRPIFASSDLPETGSTSPLTPREAEVLSLVGKGSTTYDISTQLGISRSTVANHKERIFTKLQAKNQAHAVARAVNLGLIAPGREANVTVDLTETEGRIEGPRRAG